MTVIGVPKETKVGEFRVALTPAAVGDLVRSGHRVLVETGAGTGSGFADEEYLTRGGELVPTEDAWTQCEVVVKVKEPVASEYRFLSSGTALFSYLHLAAEPDLTGALLAAGTTALAYETVVDDRGALPLLAPMSAIAGRVCVQAAANLLHAQAGGSGVLLAPVGGVAPGRVVVVGGGVVGINAAAAAAGLGANVTIFDASVDRLVWLQQVMPANVTLEAALAERIEAEVAIADVVVGAVLIPGAKAAHVVSAAMVKQMRPGSVVCDVAIDQGGCIETSRPTTHEVPTYREFGVTHYAVTNMPAAVPRTSTQALVNATLPYVRALAGLGVRAALDAPRFKGALNIRDGLISHEAVAAAFV